VSQRKRQKTQNLSDCDRCDTSWPNSIYSDQAWAGIPVVSKKRTACR